MLDVTLLPLQQLLRERKRGHTLPAAFYRDPDIFAADMEGIFKKHWIYVGVEPDVAEPGDVMTVEVTGASILILRDDDYEVRAFYNVCRHRGARLVHEEGAPAAGASRAGDYEFSPGYLCPGAT
jgi:Rieske 2Fe-2S family protein